MAVEIYLPKMSDHMETGRIIRWLFKEGDAVKSGQVLLELETDKAVGEIEATASGILKNIRAGDGEEVPVGETLAYIARPDEVVPQLKPFGAAAETAGQAAEVSAAPAETVPDAPAGEGGIVPATPVARKVAKELGVDLHKVKGTGPGGRVKEEDVRAYAEAQMTVSTPVPAPSPLPLPQVDPAPAVPPASAPAAPEKDGEHLGLTNIQRITGQRMLESVTTAPHFFLQANIDMTRALELIESASQPGERVSVTSLLVRVVAAALKHHPRVNASFENGAIRAFSQIHIGVAVGTDQGLAVPVVHDASSKLLVEINHEVKEFQSKAKEMRFSPADLDGGTFTISNLGMYGVDVFSAIINPPQSAILAVGRVVKTAVVLEDDTVEVRPMMAVTLSVDHRVLDGIQAARFLAELRNLLENPYLLV